MALSEHRRGKPRRAHGTRPPPHRHRTPEAAPEGHALRHRIRGRRRAGSDTNRSRKVAWAVLQRKDVHLRHASRSRRISSWPAPVEPTARRSRSIPENLRSGRQRSSASAARHRISDRAGRVLRAHCRGAVPQQRRREDRVFEDRRGGTELPHRQVITPSVPLNASGSGRGVAAL
jgi:hypothetical protein